jgi:hypothetical protein
MGWIHDRHMRSGGSLNRRPERQRKGPLRKIVHTIHHATGLFDTARVELECGHEVNSNGMYKARCDKCAEIAASNVEKLVD